LNADPKFAIVPRDCSSPATDVAGNNYSNEILVYPNPSGGEFNVQMNKYADVQVKIYNVYGECVYQHTCTSAHPHITLSETPGVYFLRVNGTLSIPIVIRK
jgi:hypothetical protein